MPTLRVLIEVDGEAVIDLDTIVTEAHVSNAPEVREKTPSAVTSSFREYERTGYSNITVGYREQTA